MLYLDEPTIGLDPLSRNEMWDVVRGLTATGVTVLLTTQYLEEADQLAEDIAVVDHGTVIATGTPDELKARTGAQTLSVRPANPADVPAVVAIVAGLSRAEPEVRNTTVTVPVSQEDVLPGVMRRFEDAGIRVAELNLRGSSPDAAFCPWRPVLRNGRCRCRATSSMIPESSSVRTSRGPSMATCTA